MQFDRSFNITPDSQTISSSLQDSISLATWLEVFSVSYASGHRKIVLYGAQSWDLIFQVAGMCYWPDT